MTNFYFLDLHNTLPGVH